MSTTPISLFRALAHRVTNLPVLRPMVERNRWLVAAYFDYRYLRTDPYAYDTDASERLKREQVAGFLNDRQYEDILEVGCGEGYMTQALLPLGRTLTGLDISKRAIRRARARYRQHPQVTFMAADILTFNSPRRFDLITCSEMLYYLSLDQIEQAVRNMAGHLAPAGRFLSVHTFSSAESSQGLELKQIGAGAIHSLVQKAIGLRVVRKGTFGQCEMILFQAGTGPEGEPQD